jgi:hypothetical protein
MEVATGRPIMGGTLNAPEVGKFSAPSDHSELALKIRRKP